VKTVFAVMMDLLREAASRKWFLGLAIALTLALGTLGLSLKLEVVDGALAASRLFGKTLDNEIMSVDVILRPIFRAASYLTFYGGLVFGIVACSDFAPSLLAPGRIEHLLSLPVKRWQLLLGTFLGVLVLALMAALYGAGGFTLLFGIKSGVWTVGPLLAGLLAAVTFAAIYAAMLTSALVVRNAAVSAGIGFVLFACGILASYRTTLAPMFEEGLGRETFKMVTLLLPRVSALADAGADIAASAPLEVRSLTSLILGVFVFGLGLLSLGAWRFEQKDF
jgi:Cu-processing system permease protein